jgi:hypothetical protein
MITVATLAYLALLSDTPVESLSTPRGRALAMFEVARRRDGVKWYANDALVALVGSDATGYRVTVDGAPIYADTLGSMIRTVQRLVVGLDVPLKPTPTARAYKQFAFWADAQDGYLMSYVMFADGGWDEEPAAVEFACQHMVDHANADFGTSFTMDDFQEGDDCSCAT